MWGDVCVAVSAGYIYASQLNDWWYPASHGRCVTSVNNTRHMLAPRIRTLIVDDEPLGRERIRTLLEHREDIENVGECQNGREAVESIRALSPDLVFLDIQMPELDGFEVIREVGPRQMPHVIFVTAYDQHALEAFSVHALDYLLKPFDVERFQKALRQAVHRITTEKQVSVATRIEAMLQDVGPAPQWLDRLMVKARGRYTFVLAKDIDWIEATGNYATLHAGGQKHLIRQTMTGLEDQLDPKIFLRIHRSTIVNLDRVKEFYPMASGEYEVCLVDGTRLTLSRSYRKALERFST